MRLIFIRHGDPDYEKDSVTEKGEREIELLADKLEGEKITAFYLSPKGRAQRPRTPRFPASVAKASHSAG